MFKTYKRLLKSIGKYKTASLLAPATIAFEVVMEVIIPLLMAKLIDNGVNKGDMSYILRIGAILAGCCIISLCGGVLSGRFAAVASAGFGANLRHDMYKNIQTFSFSNIDKFSTASIVTRLTTDVTRVTDAYQMMIRTAIRGPLMMIFSFVMAFNIHPTLTLVYLAVAPLLAVGLLFIAKTVHPVFVRVFKRYDTLNRVVQENLRGIRVVKSFVREDHEREKFNTVSDDIYKDFTTAEKRLALNAPMMQLSVNTCLLVIAWFGSKYIVNSGGTAMTTGQLVSLTSYTMQILMSLIMLSFVFVMMTISRASSERIYEILEEKSDIVSPDNGICDIPDGSVQFENVSFSYSEKAEKPVLDCINLDIKSGETIGIIGMTGSAKTSLVQLIPRLYDTTKGIVKVGGIDVRDYDLEALRDEVSMVLQKNLLFSGTIKENLRWGNENASDEELERVCRLACADEFIREFSDGYDSHIEQGGANVSGGQKQRLCIARALLKKPKILILDDSTSAVDTHTDAKIRKALAEETPDTTKIIIAQRVASVEDADRIIVMNDGKVEAFGSHNELLANNEMYRNVYESQMKGSGSVA
ncbi:MAG: ABC transporter ATP-binding protein [Clostridiales bacterium]|nr:ABC transporter ATP-binding protein [Clostridiales bacterium]